MAYLPAIEITEAPEPPGPPRLVYITVERLVSEMRHVVETKIRRLQGLVSGVQVPELPALDKDIQQFLAQLLGYARFGIPMNLLLNEEGVVFGGEPKFAGPVSESTYQAIWQLAYAGPFVDPGEAHSHPWKRKDVDPQSYLECVLRAAVARHELTVAEYVPVGWVAALASLPVNTMRVYGGREGLRTPKTPKGHVHAKIAASWLESRGVLGPPMTKAITSDWIGHPDSEAVEEILLLGYSEHSDPDVAQTVAIAKQVKQVKQLQEQVKKAFVDAQIAMTEVPVFLQPKGAYKQIQKLSAALQVPIMTGQQKPASEADEKELKFEVIKSKPNLGVEIDYSSLEEKALQKLVDAEKLIPAGKKPGT